MYRGLGAPAVLGDSVVFGDADGTLHWLSRDEGRGAVARCRPTAARSRCRPCVSAGTLLVVTRSGGVFAFRAA